MDVSGVNQSTSQKMNKTITFVPKILSGNMILTYVLIFTLFYLSALLFSPTLTIPLLSDDYIWVRDTARYQTFNSFISDTFAFKETDFRYRPLMPTTVRLCYQISGTDPFCMHLVSFSLHFLNMLLVGKLTYILTKNKWSAWASMFFFAVYFPHVVNVAWISDVGNLLAAFFMLITVIGFLFFTGRGVYGWGGVSLLTFVLAMISKESALALAPILLVWSGILFLSEKERYRRKLLVAACSGYGLLTGLYLFLFNRTGLNFAFSGSGNYAYHFDLNTLRNALYYPLNFIRPTPVLTLEIIYQNLFDLSRSYTGEIINFLSKAWTIPDIYWVAGGTLTIWLVVFWLIFQQQTIPRLALAWIVLGILPVIFLAGHGERHLYVASIGLSLLVGYLFFGQKKDQERGLNLKTIFVLALFTVVLGFNIYWTQVRVKNWQTAGNMATTIISTVVTHYPHLSDNSELWFVGLPTDYEGAHLFRLGIDAALQLETGNFNLKVYTVPDPTHLPTKLNRHQYAFQFSNHQLIDLTANYSTSN